MKVVTPLHFLEWWQRRINRPLPLAIEKQLPEIVKRGNAALEKAKRGQNSKLHS